MDIPEVSPNTFNNVTQIVTAIGVILTAINSMLNRRKIDKVDRKIDKAATAVAEVKVAATAVNAEVVQKVHDVGVEAGKEIANGQNNGRL